MPSSPPKPCRHAGCSHVTLNGYCPQHESDRMLGKFGDERRGSRQSRGYGAEHEQSRKRVLSRDKGVCQEHRPGCRYRATQVDHKVSKADARRMGWSEQQIEADENKQAICTACHVLKTQEEAQRARRGGGG